MDGNDWWADYDHYGPLHELATNDDDDGVGVITNTNTYRIDQIRSSILPCTGH